MKLGTVIGRVTLSRGVDALQGGRFLVVSPFTREQYAAGLDVPPAMGRDFSLVVYDNLGGGVGQVIGYEEGREAAQPFDRRFCESLPHRRSPEEKRHLDHCQTSAGAGKAFADCSHSSLRFQRHWWA